MTDDKRVSDFIFQQQGKGASIQKAAANLRITYDNAKRVFICLLKSGEIFKKGGVYCSTAWFIEFDPKPTVDQVKEEILNAMFRNNGGPPAKIESFLEEYVAARGIKLTKAEAWELAKRKTEGAK